MKKAFTLAEVLITLGIIGIVAALTIPALITKWQDEAYSKQKKIFDGKFLEAVKQMNLNGDLSPYADTENFVNKFKKYMKIANVCKDEKISNCITEKIYTETGEEINLSDFKNSTNFGKTYSTKNVAISLIDGTSLLLSYDPDCTSPDPYKSMYTVPCISYVLDVNGGKKPNTIGKDIVSVGVSFNTKSCDGIEMAGICFSSAPTSFSPTSVSCACLGEPSCGPDGYEFCTNNDNYWDGAVKACQAEGKHLMTMAEAEKIGKFFEDESSADGLTESELAQAQALFELLQSNAYWLSEEIYGAFGYTYNWNQMGALKASPAPKALCIK